MIPYARVGKRGLNDSERIYNYRTTKYRREIESAFGILAKRWRILQTSMNFTLKKTKIIFMALLCLQTIY